MFGFPIINFLMLGWWSCLHYMLSSNASLILDPTQCCGYLIMENIYQYNHLIVILFCSCGLKICKTLGFVKNLFVMMILICLMLIWHSKTSKNYLEVIKIQPEHCLMIKMYHTPLCWSIYPLTNQIMAMQEQGWCEFWLPFSSFIKIVQLPSIVTKVPLIRTCAKYIPSKKKWFLTGAWCVRGFVYFL